MDAKVRLSDIRDGMEMQSDEMPSYLHRPTGRVINISDEAMLAMRSLSSRRSSPMLAGFSLVEQTIFPSLTALRSTSTG
jgi:hypothetical protein